MRFRLATLTLACALVACAPASAAPADPLGHAGRWITDATGRVVILHGLNVVAKRPPYAPDALGFGADDAAFLARNGFGVVRLGLMWSAVEPHPGVYDDAYLDRIARTQRLLARAGIWSQLDFHQDAYNERFGGQGMPDWATLDDGLPSDPGYPVAQFFSLGNIRAWDNFWANSRDSGGVGLQDRYAAAWRHVAARFAGVDHVIGYDLLNEPWPGTSWPLCANTAVCPQHQQLAAFYRKVIAAVRQVDRSHIAWYEPNLLTAAGAAVDLPKLGDSRAGLSFHVYCLTAALGGGNDSPALCPGLEQVAFDQAESHSAASGSALLMTEFGSTNDTAAIRRVAAEADRNRVGWTEWTYSSNGRTDFAGTPSLVHDPDKPPAGANVDAGQRGALLRVAPRVVAGTPADWSYDPATKVFRMRWSSARAGGGGRFGAGAISEVTVPEDLYPGGYAAAVAGGTVVSARRSTVLKIAGGARSVSLVLRPGAGGAFPRERVASFSARVVPKRDARRPYRFSVSGRVGLPEGVRTADGCAGAVRVRIGRAKAGRARVRPDCTWRLRVLRRRAGRAKAAARFAGNAVLGPSMVRRFALRAGT